MEPRKCWKRVACSLVQTIHWCGFVRTVRETIQIISVQFFCCDSSFQGQMKSLYSLKDGSVPVKEISLGGALVRLQGTLSS